MECFCTLLHFQMRSSKQGQHRQVGNNFDEVKKWLGKNQKIDDTIFLGNVNIPFMLEESDLQQQEREHLTG